ncbi:MAG: AMP-binding protein, partial [bacterium]|nr:AMP-binding protein [bacterium]
NNAETEDKELEMGGVDASGYAHANDFNMSKFDLIFFMDETKNGVQIRLEYNSDLFERRSAERMAANYLTLVEAVITNSDQKITQLNIPREEEYTTVTETFNQTRRPYPQLTLQERFQQQAEASAGKTAVVYKGERITYRELNRKANRLAHYLRREHKAKPNKIIGVSLERSIDMIIVLLGIMKSGAGYLAVDPAYPR